MGIHLSSCPAVRPAVTSRHNAVIIAWRGVCGAAQVRVTGGPGAEPTGILGQSSKRTDAFAALCGDGPRTWDGVISDPCCPSYVRAAAERPLFVAKAAEERKRRDYQAAAERYGTAFAPLSFEKFGAWGPAAQAELQLLAGVAAKTTGCDPGWWAQFHGRVLSAALAKAVARCLRAGSITMLHAASGRRDRAAANRRDASYYAFLEQQAAGVAGSPLAFGA